MAALSRCRQLCIGGFVENWEQFMLPAANTTAIKTSSSLSGTSVLLPVQTSKFGFIWTRVSTDTFIHAYKEFTI